VILQQAHGGMWIDPASAQAVHVPLEPDDAVGGQAHQLGLDEAVGDDLGMLGRDPQGHLHAVGQRPQVLVGDEARLFGHGYPP
jgi:hypothetical protein